MVFEGYISDSDIPSTNNLPEDSHRIIYLSYKYWQPWRMVSPGLTGWTRGILTDDSIPFMYLLIKVSSKNC
jgi:hypothetical protein